MNTSTFPRRLGAVLTLVMVVLLVGGARFYRAQERRLRQDVEAQLTAVAHLKVDEIVAWRAERLADAAVIMESPFFTEAVAQWMATPRAEATEELLIQFRSLRDHYHYRDVMLVSSPVAGVQADAGLTVRLSLSGYAGPLHADASQALVAAFRDRRAVLTDLHIGPDDLPPHLDVIAPMFARNGDAATPVGAIVLQYDARQFLFPLIESWPTPSQSAETLLVRRDGNAVLFLNDLRHQSGAALTLRIPTTQDAVPAVMAVQGKEGVVDGRDYRGVNVLSALRAVPGSPWFLVAKVDVAEAFAPWRFLAALILGLLLGGVAITSTFLLVVWQRDAKRHFRALFQAEAARRASEERYRVTLKSASDGVITADGEGRVELMNPTAERLTGWRQEDACGKPIAEVFHIVNEETRLPAENPIHRVLREGKVVGLANHTVLVARDGTEYPVADSGAPIRDEQGANTGMVMIFRDQTKERVAQAALRESEALYRSLIDHMLNGLAYCRMLFDGERPHDFVYLLVNDAFEALTGLRDVVGKKVSEVIPGIRESDAQLFEVYGRVALTGVPERCETYVKALGMWFSISVYSPKREHFVAVFDVITERKRAQETLQGERDLLRALMDNIPDAIYFTDTASRFTRVNPAVAAQLGVADPQEAIGRTNADLFSEEEVREVRADEQRVLVSGESIVDKVECIRLASGESRWVSTTKVPLRRADGVITGLVGITRDVTGRKRAEEALRETSTRFQTILDHAPVAIYVKDRDGRFILGNRALERFTGRSVAATLGTTDYDWSPVEDADRWRENDLKVLESGRVWEFEETGTDVQGRPYVNLSLKVPLTNDSGTPVAVCGISTDITERKRAQVERERLATVVEQAAEMFVITDTEGTIQYVNRAFETITGYTRTEVIGHNPGLLESGVQDARYFRDIQDTVSRGETWHGRIVNRKKDGSRYTEETTVYPVRNSEGAIVSYAAAKRDITHELQLEAQLLQAQKMEAVGQLAGGVAHDFNNKLTVILGCTGLVLDAVGPHSPLREDLLGVTQAAQGAADLTRQLLAFARKEIIKPRVLDLNDSVAGLLKMLRRLIGEDIELAWIPGHDLWQVRIDPSQIDQVLANLALNARDAIAGVGKITIETENVVLDEAAGVRLAELTPGEYVMLTLSDNGCGMDKLTLSRIFEPFFTTKGVGKGTGLGLATVYGVVTQNHGLINVYSEPGQGTTFRVYLPRIAEAMAEATAESAGAAPPGGTETVLIVEDEDAVLRLSRRILEALGYTVLSAGTPVDAIRLVTDYPGVIDLLITDVVMPEMNGRDLADRVTSLQPGLKCLFMSGYAANLIAHRNILDEGVHFMEKPFTRDTLASEVRSALEQE